MTVLEVIAFISGAVVMILELVGSRILAPYLGTSIFVWTSLIGIILGSLSLGYFWGGRLADRNPTHRNLSYILFFSGLSLLITAIVKEMVLSGIEVIITNIRIGAVVATTVLFAPPSIVLAMTVPYIVRLKMETVDRSGSTVGRLYSISTIGSIVGTFLAGFFLIAYFGSSKIMYFLAATMFLASILAYAKGFREVLVLVAFSFPFLVGARNMSALFDSENLADVDTDYNRVTITDTTDSSGNSVRLLKINDDNSSAAFVNRDDLYFEYTKYYSLAVHFKKDLKRCLMLGGGAYSFPKYFVKRFPHAEIHVVEIDPELTMLAQKYFGLSHNPRLKIFHEDGRTFLNHAREKYDVVLVDVFKSLYSLPAHLTTVEAASRIRDVLVPDGLVLANVISSIDGDSSKFLRAEYRTYQQKFPHLELFVVQKPQNARQVQNCILAAFKRNPDEKLLSAAEDPELAEFLKHRWLGKILLDVPVLTDDFCPVENYSLAAIPK